MSAQVVRVDSRTVWRPINQEADLRNHHHTCSAESERNWAFLTDRAIHSLSRCCGEGGILRELAGCQTACVFSPARISFYSVLLTVPTIQTRLTVILENCLEFCCSSVAYQIQSTYKTDILHYSAERDDRLLSPFNAHLFCAWLE